MKPFRLETRPVPRVWGGNRLQQLFGGDKSEQPIGERWDIHGSLRQFAGGPTLDALLAQYQLDLVGSWGASSLDFATPTFPLLIKWLDCQDWLSIQVHPDDPTARQLTGEPAALGKNECWYFLEVQPDSELLHGWKSVPDSLQQLTGQEWLELARRYHPRVGEWLHVPAGTIHALGPGLVLFEVQQSSDLTYRLYDWDRLGLDGVARDLHLEEGRHCAGGFQLPPDPDVSQIGALLGELRVLCPYFSVEEVSGSRSWSVEPVTCEIVTALTPGILKISAFELAQGDSAVLPASCGEVHLEAEADARWARIRLVPPPSEKASAQQKVTAGS